LLGQDEPGEVVRQRERRKSHSPVGAPQDIVGETESAADQERHTGLTLPPALDGNATFDRAAEEIGLGHHAEGRRRIYALMAVVDRQPQAVREDRAARAAFLLGRSYHLQALAAGERR
jgi:hypothetical protein